jgi:hypothetical protein
MSGFPKQSLYFMLPDQPGDQLMLMLKYLPEILTKREDSLPLCTNQFILASLFLNVIYHTHKLL